ncbi:MAG: glycoside hydrolase family 88 protein [Verrucomicrobiota bacterium]
MKSMPASCPRFAQSSAGLPGGWFVLWLFLAFVWPPSVGALEALPDFARTPANVPVVIPVLANDSATASMAVLRFTPPAHGRVVLNSNAVTNAELASLIAFAAHQLSNTVAQVGNSNLYPWLTLPDGTWDTAAIGDNNWISGFFPGSLWLIYEETGDIHFREWAESWTAGIAPMQYSTNVDDVGFMINTSFGNGYRLTTNTVYRAVLLQAAQSLTNRFNPIVGCLADDRLLAPPTFEVILDTMMNSELLFRAFELSGDTNFYQQAISHALHTRLNQLRPDGSTFHMVLYDSTDGSVLYQGNRAIDPPMDTWARGHAWATYGFTMAFQATGDARFLDTAKRTADFYLDHVPADRVPYWYFQSNSIPPAPPLRDSSAAAITLSALIELGQCVTNDVDAARLWLGARQLFDSLRSTNYLAQGTSSSGVLLHGNPVDSNRDTSLIYGDYYFIEALARFREVFQHTSLTYLPDPGYSGADAFSYQACDDAGNCSTAVVSVAVGLEVEIQLSPAQQPVLSFPTESGKTYFVQWRPDLSPASNWQMLATNLPGSGGVLSFADTNRLGQRFYRVGAN